jgi:hypothetical protein
MGEIRKKKILVLGAAGQVGGLLIPHLLGHDSVEVVTASRKPENASGLGIPSVYLDLDKFESILPALQGVDRIFLMTGHTAAGGEPAYMKCVYECYRDFGAGKLIGDEIFDNFTFITGRQPKTIEDFIDANADVFRY